MTRGDRRPLPHDVRAAMTGVSWRPDVPVTLFDLALLEVPHTGFDGADHTGHLVVAAAVADAVLDALAALHAARYPIERMLLVDTYGADDDRSMAANNSSGFNGRCVAGTTRWSQHAYGLAIDLNPVQNPWLHDGRVDPPAGAAFVDRSAAAHPALIKDGDVVVRAFAAIGWEWGGRWAAPDLHHFQVGRGA